jgi:glycosyltransferase involved in cell wall biosynthesis
MSKLVSVIIPTHNYARFIRRAVDSVLAQTYPSVECVVVDDGSTDDTPQVLAGYGDRIRVIRTQQQGPATARNAGIRSATGEFIAFLDADDRWLDHKLARQVEVLETDPSLGAVGCAVIFVNAAGDETGRHTFPTPPVPTNLERQLRDLACRRLWVGGSCSGVLVRRPVLDDVGLFDESLKAAEDWDLWMRLVAKHPYRNLPEPLVQITRHDTGFARNVEKVERNQWLVHDKAVERWPHVLKGLARKRMRALIHADAGGEYLGGDRFDLALRRYTASLCEWPAHRGRWYMAAKLFLRRMTFRKVPHAAATQGGRP